MAIGFNLDENEEPEGWPTGDLTALVRPVKFRCYAVSLAGRRGIRFMTHMQLAHFIAASLRDKLPDIGEDVVYNDVHPFGCTVKWQRVEGGMTRDEMIDSNLNGEIVIHV